jgi:AraC-like DNA-binding protein
MDAIGRALEGESGAFWNGQQDGNGTESLGGGWQTERVSEAPAAAITRGGLAPWQVKRVTTHIDAHLESVIPIRDLAQVAGLSVSHFMRAFRASFGHSPHRFIMRRRLERAQGLMLTSGTPLGQIALECGLADQSHLTRLFRRFVGESPGMWRRARATPRR